MDLVVSLVVAVMLFSKPFWIGIAEGIAEGFGKAK